MHKIRHRQSLIFAIRVNFDLGHRFTIAKCLRFVAKGGEVNDLVHTDRSPDNVFSTCEM